MKFKVHLFLVLSFPFLVSCSSSDPFSKRAQKDAHYNLLFVGNSLTYTNDLPQLVKEMASSRNVIINTTMLAKPNYALVDHWMEGTVQELIRTGNFDFVIIQQGPSSQPEGYNMLVNDGKKYSALCKTEQAKLAFFMVWPSRRYYESFPGVIENYTQAAKINDAILCPVGKIWKQHFDATGDFSYYGPDQFHPSLSGSRVAAKVILESLDLK